MAQGVSAAPRSEVPAACSGIRGAHGRGARSRNRVRTTGRALPPLPSGPSGRSGQSPIAPPAPKHAFSSGAGGDLAPVVGRHRRVLPPRPPPPPGGPAPEAACTRPPSRRVVRTLQFTVTRALPPGICVSAGAVRPSVATEACPAARKIRFRRKQ